MGIFDLFKSEKRTTNKRVKQLMKQLQKEGIPDSFARMNAKELGQIGEPALNPLIQALRHKKAYVREAAGYALGEMRDARAVEPLIQALKDKDFDVREKAAEALGKVGDKRAVEPLIGALNNVRYKAAEALGKIGDARAVEPLIQVLKEDSGVRFAAGILREPSLAVASAVESYIRRAAAEALGKIGDKRAVEALTQALKDETEDRRVREVAKEALEKIEAKKR